MVYNELNEFKERTRKKIVWNISIFVFVVLLILLPLHFSKHPGIIGMIAFGMVLTGVSMFLIKYKDHYKFSYYLLSFGTIVGSLVASLFVHETPVFTNVLWFLCGILVAFFGLGNRYGIAVTLVSALGIVLFIFLGLDNHLSAENLPVSNDTKLALTIETLAIIGICVYLTFNFVYYYNFSERVMRLAFMREMNRNNLLNKADEEKTALLQEVHHRVKNNLQVVISILRIKNAEIDNPDVKEHFDDAINRLISMSNVHQKLYKQENIAHVDVKNYFEDMVSEFINFSSINQPVKCHLSIDNITLNVNDILQLGMLVNELLSNSFKHAFSSEKPAEINLGLTQNGDTVLLTYSDNGIWKNHRKPGSVGLELIDAITEQLNGQFNRIDNDNGTFYSFVLEINPVGKSIRNGETKTITVGQ